MSTIVSGYESWSEEFLTQRIGLSSPTRAFGSEDSEDEDCNLELEKFLIHMCDDLLND